MTQYIIVMVIVLVAILFTSRRVYRILSNKKAGCGCEPVEGCSSCAVPANIKGSGSGDRSDSTPGAQAS
jgi:hypothetical protein